MLSPANPLLSFRGREAVCPAAGGGFRPIPTTWLGQAQDIGEGLLWGVVLGLVALGLYALAYGVVWTYTAAKRFIVVNTGFRVTKAWARVMDRIAPLHDGHTRLMDVQIRERLYNEMVDEALGTSGGLWKLYGSDELVLKYAAMRPQRVFLATDCMICFDSIQQDRAGVLPCGHMMCDECRERWLLLPDRRRGCPVCTSPPVATL